MRKLWPSHTNRLTQNPKSSDIRGFNFKFLEMHDWHCGNLIWHWPWNQTGADSGSHYLETCCKWISKHLRAYSRCLHIFVVHWDSSYFLPLQLFYRKPIFFQYYFPSALYTYIHPQLKLPGHKNGICHGNLLGVAVNTFNLWKTFFN